MRGYSIKFNF